MLKKEIQIVAFNNPYPPDFGGAIDMFYKIAALSDLGVKVHLHIFYDKRSDVQGLLPLCETITLYKRKKSIAKHFSFLPFCVNTRISRELFNNLNKSEAPIIFESIRTTGILLKHLFKQKIAIRCHNIEHDYSWGLFNSEKNWIKKLAFLIEGYKLKYYESILDKADFLFALSYYEYTYFKTNQVSETIFLPVFQANNKIESKIGLGDYALYHGDLNISDNIRSALFIADVFKEIEFPLVIASSTANGKINKEILKHDNISFKLIKNDLELNTLIKHAHINALFSFQKSGTKLKVFNALFKGRHCIVNTNMIDDPDVLRVCHVAEDKTQYHNTVKQLLTQDYIVSNDLKKVIKKYESVNNAAHIIKVLCN